MRPCARGSPDDSSSIMAIPLFISALDLPHRTIRLLSSATAGSGLNTKTLNQFNAGVAPFTGICSNLGCLPGIRRVVESTLLDVIALAFRMKSESIIRPLPSKKETGAAKYATKPAFRSALGQSSVKHSEPPGACATSSRASIQPAAATPAINAERTNIFRRAGRPSQRTTSPSARNGFQSKPDFTPSSPRSSALARPAGSGPEGPCRPSAPRRPSRPGPGSPIG